jgi:3D (Asp-Asp-Asp) domain-containing protein
LPTRSQLAVLALLSTATVVASCAARTHAPSEPDLSLDDPSFGQSHEVIATPAEPVVEVVNDEPAPEQAITVEPEPRVPGRELGSFRLTYYWITSETDHAGAKRSRKIYDKTCKPIAKVPRTYAKRLAMEGTGRLADGRVVSVAGRCRCGFSPCFFVAGDSHPWGAGVRSRPLHPFRSVAVDSRRIAIGTELYIPELDGRHMPGDPPWGDFVHDGCVVADDRGGGVRGKKIDLFAGRRDYYRELHEAKKLTRITVHKGASHCATRVAQAD